MLIVLALVLVAAAGLLMVILGSPKVERIGMVLFAVCFAVLVWLLAIGAPIPPVHLSR